MGHEMDLNLTSYGCPNSPWGTSIGRPSDVSVEGKGMEYLFWEGDGDHSRGTNVDMPKNDGQMNAMQDLLTKK